MTLENLTQVNAIGGVQARNTKTGADIYLKPGEILHDLALDGTFGPVAPYVPPPDPVEPPTYPDAAAAIEAVAEWAEGFVRPLVAGVPAEERLSWPVKEVAAAALLDGTADAAQTALIEGEAAVTGEAPADLAGLILQRAAVYRPAVAAIAGLRRDIAAKLRAEPDPYKFDAILAAAKADAVQLARDLGLAAELGLD